MTDRNKLIENILIRLYKDSNGVLKIIENHEKSCIFCKKKPKEKVILNLKFEDKLHEFTVNFCKKHLKIFNEDVIYYNINPS